MGEARRKALKKKRKWMKKHGYVFDLSGDRRFCIRTDELYSVVMPFAVRTVADVTDWCNHYVSAARPGGTHRLSVCVQLPYTTAFAEQILARGPAALTQWGGGKDVPTTTEEDDDE